MPDIYATNDGWVLNGLDATFASAVEAPYKASKSSFSSGSECVDLTAIISAEEPLYP